jgi:hypothetical protein
LRAKVQVTAPVSAGTNPWDHHTDIIPGLMKCCPQVDQPTAGLIQDLKQRGLLDTTIVWWTGEFGRLPITRGHRPRPQLLRLQPVVGRPRLPPRPHGLAVLVKRPG